MVPSTRMAVGIAGVYPALCPGEYLELRAAHHASGRIVREWFTHPGVLARRACALSAQGYHAWYGINPRDGCRGGDDHCTRAPALPADIDAKLWGGDLGATGRAISAFGLRPSLNVCSGGGFQPRWFLEAPLDLRTPEGARRYRVLSLRLARALVGADRIPDTVNNPERVLRVPGTLNWKPEYGTPRPVTVAWVEPERRYTPAAIEAWLDEQAAWTRLAPVAPVQAPAPRATGGVIADFNERYDPLPLLLLAGARTAHVHGAVTHLTRPGKQRGVSATYNYYPNTLIVFSENWPPFAAWRPGGQGRRGYDPFAIFTLLAHGGDARAAYRAAADLGYGEVHERHGLRVVRPNPQLAVRQLVGGVS